MKRFIVIWIFASGCATYQSQLARAQRAFEGNEHEHALAMLRDLESDTGKLTPSERTQYDYLRGMTDYRIGYLADARHWLALAQAEETSNTGSLPDDWKRQLVATIPKLSNEVYVRGASALSNRLHRDAAAADDIDSEEETPDRY